VVPGADDEPWRPMSLKGPQWRANANLAA